MVLGVPWERFGTCVVENAMITGKEEIFDSSSNSNSAKSKSNGLQRRSPKDPDAIGQTMLVEIRAEGLRAIFISQQLIEISLEVSSKLLSFRIFVALLKN